MTETIRKTGTVRVSRHYEASPERVFDAWLDPKVAAKFLFATPNGTMIKAEIDPKVGGHFTFTDRRPDMGEVEHVGTWLEIDRPRRLVFEFAVPAYEPSRTRITLEFAADGAGCALTLTHEGVFEDYLVQTNAGWGMILDALARALAA
ncbi:SRPBCC domain-containing protein [Phenylobacterium sp.]|uniref:SRPBCC family protein n=1 Tax=Phenylobacterium sp. TaxID=1871053 RepID=UPI002F3F8DAA